MINPGRVVKNGLRRTVGLWPLHEYRNRVVRGWRALPLSSVERREVARLAKLVGLREARVAVVVPTYRRPTLLRAAVDSVLEQTLSDFVVVVVDDGGRQLPELPEDDRLVTVSLEHNTGCLGVVRNVGIALTSSTYVAFLDDDNQWTPDHLAESVAELDRGVDLTYTTVERRFPDGRLYDRLDRAFDRRVFRDDSYVDANSIVVRRRPHVRFSRIPRTSLTFPKEDWEFVYRLSKRMSVRHVDVASVRYLINDQSYYTEPWGSR